jgi:hypothetical protein
VPGGAPLNPGIKTPGGCLSFDSMEWFNGRRMRTTSRSALPPNAHGFHVDLRTGVDACGRYAPQCCGLCCWLNGITDLLLLGIVSRPWLLLASLPPEVDVPLPLLFGAIPVVSLDEFDELAAGRGVPGPPGLLWAYASVPERANATAMASVVGFMTNPFLQANGRHEVQFHPAPAR